MKVAESSEIIGLGFRDKKPILERDGGAQLGPFDLVIVATGFELETCWKNTVACSYWDNEDLIKPSSSAPKSVLISGVGDGGILEVLRLVYADFDNGRLTERVARHLDHSALRERILEIEKTARGKSTHAEVCAALRSGYLSLVSSLPSDLPGKIKAPCAVRLLARGGAPFIPTSAPVHRLMLARAIQAGAVHVEAGDLKELPEGLVAADATGKTIRKIDQDLVVKRIGAPRAIESLCKAYEEQIAKLKSVQEVLSEYQSKPEWPRDFFSGPIDPTRDKKVAETKEMEARASTALPFLANFGTRSWGVRGNPTTGELEYAIFLGDAAVSKKQPIPTRLFGRRVGIATFNFTSSSDASPEFVDFQKRRSLQLGDKLRVASRSGRLQEGRIGCIVERENSDQLLAMTALHTLDAPVGAPVYARSPLSDAWDHIGDVDAPPSKVGSVDWADIGAVALKRAVAVDPRAKGKPVHQLADPLAFIGAKVERFDDQGKPVTGTVDGIAVNIEIGLPNGERRSLSRGIIVSGDYGTAFSRKGDFGALVCTPDGQALGLVVADDGSHSLISPLAPTLAAMKSRLAVAPRRGTAKVREPAPENIRSAVTLIKRWRDTAKSRSGRYDIPLLALQSASENFSSYHALGWKDLRESEWDLSHASALRQSLVAGIASDRPLFRMRGLDRAIMGLPVSRARALQPYTASNLQILVKVFGLQLRVDLNVGVPRNLIGRAIRGDAIRMTDGIAILHGMNEAAGAFGTETKLLDAMNGVTFAPTFFGLSAFKSQARSHALAPLLERTGVARHTGLQWETLLQDMLHGRLVTFETAQMLREILGLMGVDPGQVVPATEDELRNARSARGEVELLRHLYNYVHAYGD